MFIIMPVCCCTIECQYSTNCLVFPGMTSSLVKSKQIIGCALSSIFKFEY